jgi:biopolymer transport protein ExbD
MIKFKGNPTRNIDIDLVPLINIVFLLLIFFMLTSSSISGVLKAELPEVYSTSKVHGKNILIKISRAGFLEVNGTTVGRDELQSQVE